MAKVNNARGAQYRPPKNGAGGSSATKKATSGPGNAPAGKYTRSNANVGGKKGR